MKCSAGAKVQMSFRAGKLFQLRCLRGAVALDGGALPRFADPQSVDLVRIEKCAAPQGAGVSYAAALASLGILAPGTEFYSSTKIANVHFYN